MGEIDILLANEKPAEPEAVPLTQTNAPPVSRKGDLWLIGFYRLYCGDALERASWQTLMDIHGDCPSSAARAASSSRAVI